MKYDFDCVVIGAGIAGMTAALYLKRAKVNVTIIDSGAPGGKLNNIKDIQNYPGFKKISGPDLAFNVFNQINDLGIPIRYGNVINIENHTIITDIEEITANKIIIATGRTAKKTTLDTEFKNVSYCALCDGNLYSGKRVAILGKKETIVEELMYLSDIVEELLVFSTDEQISEVNKDNVKIINGASVNNLRGEKKFLTEIITSKGNFLVDGLFIALGNDPTVNFLKNLDKDNNYIVVDKNMKTSIDYIYACGDVIKKDLYQLSTAIGEAAIAAVNVKKNL